MEDCCPWFVVGKDMTSCYADGGGVVCTDVFANEGQLLLPSKQSRPV